MARKNPGPGSMQRHPSHTKTLIAKYLGSKIRESRNICGLSLKSAAERIGVTPQQFNRYEAGANAMGSEVLVRWCRVTGKSPNFFLLDAPLTEDALADSVGVVHSSSVMKDAYWLARMMNEMESDQRSRMRWFMQDIDKMLRSYKRSLKRNGDEQQDGDE